MSMWTRGGGAEPEQVCNSTLVGSCICIGMAEQEKEWTSQGLPLRVELEKADCLKGKELTHSKGKAHTAEEQSKGGHNKSKA